MLFQAGAMEGAGQQFADDGFVTLRLKARNEFAALALGVKQAAHGTQVAHMHNRAPGTARCGHKLLDVLYRRVHAREGERAAEVFFLGVDDHQGRMIEVGCCVTATAELKHRLWNGHSGAPVSGAFATLSTG